ncbi:hypothetical protein GCM10023156_26060 [Novipirellula rosea]|uniref:Uncharacterized protein n=1 Tax=Novipirellula rosea TaxID=1031540 RepID=A0ABP8MPS0_9BACT
MDVNSGVLRNGKAANPVKDRSRPIGINIAIANEATKSISGPRKKNGSHSIGLRDAPKDLQKNAATPKHTADHPMTIARDNPYESASNSDIGARVSFCRRMVAVTGQRRRNFNCNF